MGEPGQAAFPVRSRRPSPERGRLIDALSAVARRAHAELPPELFPRVTSDGACVDHRVCTAACPTGALQIEATDHTASLTFDATTCIACGACQRACPEGALSMEAHGGQPARVAVALHLRRTCVACGDAYTPRTDEETCPPCTKSRRFVGDAMTRLFSQRPEAAGE
jgi:ferredoxin